ncbi:uncharacterized protein EMH_0013240 [Eimeria mitis]|uniref:Uncharacterized protein n=1 Tax=Eimeria mitis TaxID=44415 RepID=U6K752_9EIME|nr:uncharacterized protein EMH_0013240 [Eimeria mitis]CDJ32666.1 hypothetical protein EMH_0013240 [Eimeria mitis]
MAAADVNSQFEDLCVLEAGKLASRSGLASNSEVEQRIGEWSFCADQGRRGAKSGRMHSSVINPFCTSKKFKPVRCVLSGVKSQILHQRAVSAFGLALGLRMVGGGHVVVDAEPFHEAAPEGANELRIPVGNDAFWEAVEISHMINEEGHSFRCDHARAGNKCGQERAYSSIEGRIVGHQKDLAARSTVVLTPP